MRITSKSSEYMSENYASDIYLFQKNVHTAVEFNMLNKCMKQIIFLLLIILSSSTFADDAEELKFIDGIWQFVGYVYLEPEANSNEFFSLHYDGNALVLVNFSYLQLHGNPLAATFMGKGKTREFLLEALDYAPIIPSFDTKHTLQVTFTSDTEAIVNPIFDSPIIQGARYKIRKIFK